MEPLGRWEAGPAKDHPPINADHGKFTYHRLKDDGGIEKVDGFLHKYTANIAHSYDEGVTVEDLGDIDIEQDQFVEDFRKMLPRFLRETQRLTRTLNPSKSKKSMEWRLCVLGGVV